MMEFISITFGIMCGTVLTYGVILSIILNKKFIEWYMRKVMGIMKSFEEIAEDLFEDESEDL